MSCNGFQACDYSNLLNQDIGNDACNGGKEKHLCIDLSSFDHAVLCVQFFSTPAFCGKSVLRPPASRESRSKHETEIFFSRRSLIAHRSCQFRRRHHRHILHFISPLLTPGTLLMILPSSFTSQIRLATFCTLMMLEMEGRSLLQQLEGVLVFVRLF